MSSPASGSAHVVGFEAALDGPEGHGVAGLDRERPPGRQADAVEQVIERVSGDPGPWQPVLAGILTVYEGQPLYQGTVEVGPLE